MHSDMLNRGSLSLPHCKNWKSDMSGSSIYNSCLLSDGHVSVDAMCAYVIPVV